MQSSIKYIIDRWTIIKIVQNYNYLQYFFFRYFKNFIFDDHTCPPSLKSSIILLEFDALQFLSLLFHYRTTRPE